jgi:hypothetical protein
MVTVTDGFSTMMSPVPLTCENDSVVVAIERELDIFPFNCCDQDYVALPQSFRAASRLKRLQSRGNLWLGHLATFPPFWGRPVLVGLTIGLTIGTGTGTTTGTVRSQLEALRSGACQRTLSGLTHLFDPDVARSVALLSRIGLEMHPTVRSPTFRHLTHNGLTFREEPGTGT